MLSPEMGCFFMWRQFNPNPAGRAVGDCAVRAVSVALGVDWETAYAMLAVNGFAMGDILNSNSVTGATLRQHGFKRANIPNECPDCFTIRDFCRRNPKGTFMLGTGSHVVSVIDGDYIDAWDSGAETVSYVWYKDITPVFDT